MKYEPYEKFLKLPKADTNQEYHKINKESQRFSLDVLGSKYGYGTLRNYIEAMLRLTLNKYIVDGSVQISPPCKGQIAIIEFKLSVRDCDTTIETLVKHRVNTKVKFYGEMNKCLLRSALFLSQWSSCLGLVTNGRKEQWECNLV